MQTHTFEAMEEEARSFLSKFTTEFPAALEQGTALPVTPLSRKIPPDELNGESLELGLRLLSARGCPPGLSSVLCQTAVSDLMQSDLSFSHFPQEEHQEEHQEPVLFQSHAVQLLFLNKLIDSALQWQQTLPGMPLLPRFPCSIHAIRNQRRKMEDKHVTIPYYSQLLGFKDGVERSYYAVFDGHGGVDAANFASTHLHVVLGKQQKLPTDPVDAFKRAFTQTDEMFRKKAKRERLRSGSTGVAVLIQGQTLTVAWLGDSQVMLVRRGQEEELMEPHKPDREDERQRIEDLGGCVTFMGCWRVNGTYAVSRAIGDFDQKPYVSGDADCSSTELRGDEDYLLLACDGFFDSVKPQEVPALVVGALREPVDPGECRASEAPRENSDPGHRVAQRLVSHAKEAGSSDNITVMLVFLKPLLQILEENVTV